MHLSKYMMMSCSYLAMLSMLLLCSCAASSAQNSSTELSKKVTAKPQAFDLNGDNKPDAWRHYISENGKKRLDFKSFDFNFDGKIDFKRFYSTTGKVVKDEVDMDFDGKYDHTTFYKDDMIARKELRLTNNSYVKKYYQDGKLSYSKSDRNADGKPDHWQYYRDGKLVRLGHDKNNDGQPDYWEELD